MHSTIHSFVYDPLTSDTVSVAHTREIAPTCTTQTIGSLRSQTRVHNVIRRQARSRLCNCSAACSLHVSHNLAAGSRGHRQIQGSRCGLDSCFHCALCLFVIVRVWVVTTHPWMLHDYVVEQLPWRLLSSILHGSLLRPQAPHVSAQADTVKQFCA